MVLKNLISSILTLLLAPNKVSTARSKSDTAAAECAVCLSSLKSGAGTAVLPCMHEFHGDCVERWLAVPHFKSTCPICRFSLMEEWCSSNGGGEVRRRQQQECFTEEMVIWFSSFHVAGFWWYFPFVFLFSLSFLSSGLNYQMHVYVSANFIYGGRRFALKREMFSTVFQSLGSRSFIVFSCCISYCAFRYSACAQNQ